MKSTPLLVLIGIVLVVIAYLATRSYKAHRKLRSDIEYVRDWKLKRIRELLKAQKS